jgi:protein-S-isoprenylcysteine O-methyltransferase Ste14
MTAFQKCNLACWILFILYWVVTAGSVKATAERSSRGDIMAYRLPVLLGYLLLFWRRPPPPLDLRLVPGTVFAGWLGSVVCFLGLLGAIWSRTTLGQNWSSDVVFKENHELVVKGPYRLVRNPIYTSILLMCLGSAITAGRLGSWLGLLMVFAGFWIKLRQEEVLLIQHFPDEYPAYKARVKALIPYVI